MKISKPKSTAIEKEKRLFTIYGWLLEGVPDRLIVQQILQTYPIGLRQAERYVVEAYQKYKKIEGINIELKRDITIAGLYQDIRSLRPEFKGTPAGLRAVNDIKKEIAKLEGLEITKKVQISGDPDKPIETKTTIDTSVLTNEVLIALEKAYNNK